jgi:hypothetical protein
VVIFSGGSDLPNDGQHSRERAAGTVITNSNLTLHGGNARTTSPSQISN